MSLAYCRRLGLPVKGVELKWVARHERSAGLHILAALLGLGFTEPAAGGCLYHTI
jgi:hypothetical protein